LPKISIQSFLLLEAQINQLILILISQSFSYSYTCILIFIMLLGITSIKNLSIFIRINTFGVIFIFMIIFFIVGIGIFSFTNTTFVYSLSELTADTQYIKLANSKLQDLLWGILGGGYYLHNITLPIIRNNRNPRKEHQRCFHWLLFSVLYLYCMWGAWILWLFWILLTNTLGEPEINSNCLLMFSSDNILAIIIRFCVFCQVLICMVLIFACQRAQIFLLIYGT